MVFEVPAGNWQLLASSGVKEKMKRIPLTLIISKATEFIASKTQLSNICCLKHNYIERGFHAEGKYQRFDA